MKREMRQVTEFERRVYEALSKIPMGRVTSYGELARYLVCGSSQAVGQALKRNPDAPEVPCHRVIGSDLKLGGYMGKREGDEIDRKVKLLAEEGVEFDRKGELREKSCFYRIAGEVTKG